MTQKMSMYNPGHGSGRINVDPDYVTELEQERDRLQAEVVRLHQALDAVDAKVDAKVDAIPLRGVLTQLGETPAYIISVGDYKRLGGE